MTRSAALLRPRPARAAAISPSPTRHAHGAAHELEIERGDHQRLAAHRAAGDDDGVALAGLALRFLAAGRYSACGRGTSADRRRPSAARRAHTGRRRTAAPAAASSRCAYGGRNGGQTRRLASSSRWKIIWPQFGHFSQRLSGGSVLRVSACSFGRTKLVSQFMGSESFRIDAARRARRRPVSAPARARRRRAPGFALPLRQARSATRADQRRTDHGGIGDAGDGGRLLRRLDAEADGDRQVGVALQALARRAVTVGVGRRARAGDADDRDIVDEAAGVAAAPSAAACRRWSASPAG